MNYRSKIKYILILIFSTLSCNSFAGQFNHPLVYRFNYGFSGMFGAGHMGNDKMTSPDRKMDFTTYQAFLGFRLTTKYRISAFAEYAYAAQKIDPVDVAGTNLTGNSFAYGPKFEYYNGKESFGLAYRMRSDFNLEKADINGDKQYYSSQSGFNIQYTRKIKNNFGLIVDYAREEYSKSLPDKVQWDRLSVGFILTNFDKLPLPNY